MRMAAWGLFVLACGSATEAPPDASVDAGVGDAAPASDVAVEAPSDDLVSIATSPQPLTPAFSLGIHDYFVRCTAPHNAFTVTVTTTTSSTSTPEDFVPNGDFVAAGSYHVRCLPADFPELVVTPHLDKGAPTPGYYLVNGAPYAMVLDTQGTPVWYRRSTGFIIAVDSLAPNEISYAPNAELPISVDMKVSFEVRALGTLATANVTSPDAPTDVHELRRLPNGNFLVITDRVITGVDLTGLGTFGANESVIDSRIEELDPSNTVVWSWNASDHIDARLECVQPDKLQVGADVYHCNAIDVDSSGNLLLSFRNESAVFYVSKTTGSVLWKLGGTKFSKDGAELLTATDAFRLQHDARILSNGHVTMFDDGDAKSNVSSRAVEYALDHGAHTATVAFQYGGDAPSTSQGSFRRYADGHSVIGWGAPAASRFLTELDGSGNDVLDIGFTHPSVSYRAVKVSTSQLDVTLLRATSAQ